MNRYSAYITRITDIPRDIQTSLEYVKWAEHVRPGSTVFVKPNFTFYEHRPGVTTTPEVLKGLLAMLRDRAGRVIVGESDGGNHSFTADQAFRGHHMPQICQEMGAELVNLSQLPAVEVEERIQGVLVKVRLPKLLVENVDCFVSVPVLKVHAITTVSLCIKNLWGCHPDTMRCLQHSNLSYKLALIAKKVRPRLVLIDGTYALDNHGPMYGTPKKSDLMLAADNPVVSDALGAAIMGIPVSRAEHVLVAEREGLGTTDLSQVHLPLDWESYKMQMHVHRTLLDSLSTLLFKSDAIARIVMDSPLTPTIYGIAGRFRDQDEQKVVDEIGAHKCEFSK
jgi:uncharacterized protein (DUF362 family)